MIVLVNTPFGLGLSKPCPSCAAAEEEKQAFDKLRPNGLWVHGDWC